MSAMTPNPEELDAERAALGDRLVNMLASRLHAIDLWRTFPHHAEAPEPDQRFVRPQACVLDAGLPCSPATCRCDSRKLSRDHRSMGKLNMQTGQLNVELFEKLFGALDKFVGKNPEVSKSEIAASVAEFLRHYFTEQLSRGERNQFIRHVVEACVARDKEPSGSA
jgi:hypothetical protein